MSPTEGDLLREKFNDALERRAQKDRTTHLQQLNDYWRETVKLDMDRITVLTMIGAGILALQHPQFTGPSAMVLRHTLGQLTALVYEHVPAEMLEEWDRVLRTTFCS